MQPEGPLTAGDPKHPDHDAWLRELGRVTRSTAQLATICFDLARIVGGVSEEVMYDDPLGGLQRRLATVVAQGPPRMSEFMALLDSARHVRNDVMHAFLVRDGLFRRSASGGYERDFYTLESLTEARNRFEEASRVGNQILHANGGAAIKAWRQPPG